MKRGAGTDLYRKVRAVDRKRAAGAYVVAGGEAGHARKAWRKARRAALAGVAERRGQASRRAQ